MPITRRATLAGSSVFLAAPAIRAQAEPPAQMTVTSGHPPNFLWVRTMQDTFLPAVNRGLRDAGRREIKFNEAFGGTVAKLGGELQAIQSGVSDLGVISTLFQASELPLQNVTYMAPFTTDDLPLVVRVVEGMNERIPAMRDAFRRFRAINLGNAGIDTYHLFTTFPVRRIEDLNGRKIAAPGPSANWLRGTGAVAVAANLNAYYNDIRLGVYEGALTFASGAVAARLQEVAPYITLANIGAQYSTAVTLNQRVWASLDTVEQEIFRDAGRAFQRRFLEAQIERAETGLKQMQEAGAQVAPLPESERKRWADALPNIAGEWAEQMQRQSLPGREVVNAFIDGIVAGGAKPPRDWRA